ncbi:transcription termination factor Rho [Clostridiaceae bacterium HSG29]|nr:transcription termination factor Rho [Clostridiaceae bacterium HSG29]
MRKSDLEKKTVNDLRIIAKSLNMKKTSKLNKAELIDIIINGEKHKVEEIPDEFIEKLDDKDNMDKEVEGVLEVAEKGYGFLRFSNYMSSEYDVYVSASQIKKFRLITGDKVRGVTRKAKSNERFSALLYVKEVNGLKPEEAKKRTSFVNLTPNYPTEKIKLEDKKENLSLRIIDLFVPIGKGQRGMIASPPKAGKTTLLHNIAKQIEKEYPNIELIVLLIDERPEEVTEMKRLINSDVIFSTFDEEPRNHIKAAEMVLARAKALVEHGKDVIVLLDSITRLTRAYNLVIPSSGRTLSGGLDPAALYNPKRFFGAARNIEAGGSLTILATALVETGSRMDDVIFEEFKGTGNMEITLSRELSERRIFPAININKSSTRKEELLLNKKEIEAVWKLRKAYGKETTAKTTEKMISLLKQTENNDEFIKLISLEF